MDITEHWEDVYKTKCFTDVSWYESDPQKSFDLIVGAATNSLGRVIDITRRDSLGDFDVWHDRAVFHFVTDPEARRHYVELLKRSLPIGGYFVVGTFAKGGPDTCSGLPICQYDAATMQTELGPSFEPVECSEYLHTTPTGKPQQFFFGTYKRVR